MSRLRRTVLLCAAAAAGIGTPPAQADRAEHIASDGCWYGATRDHTGLAQQDPSVQTGVLVVGPAVAADVLADDGSGPSKVDVAHVVTTCWIQVNAADSWSGASRASCTATGTGIVPPVACAISFRALMTDSVYVCGEMQKSTGGFTETVAFDSDNRADGAQCRLTVSSEVATVGTANGADCYVAAIASAAPSETSVQASRETVLALQQLSVGGDDEASDDRLGSGVSCHCSAVSLFNCANV